MSGHQGRLAASLEVDIPVETAQTLNASCQDVERSSVETKLARVLLCCTYVALKLTVSGIQGQTSCEGSLQR